MKVSYKINNNKKTIKLRNSENIEFMKRTHNRVRKSKKIYDRKENKKIIKSKEFDFF